MDSSLRLHPRTRSPGRRAILATALAEDFQLALGGLFGAVTPTLALVVATAAALLVADARLSWRTQLACAYLSIPTGT